MSSCSDKLIPKGSSIYSANTPNADRPSQRDVYNYKTSSKHKISSSESVKVNDDHIVVKADVSSWNKNPVKIGAQLAGKTDHRNNFLDPTDAFFFPYPGISDNAKFKLRTGNNFFKGWKFSAVTVTAKRRSSISDKSKDHIAENNLTVDTQNTWEAKFTPGFALTNELVKWTTYGQDMSTNSVSIIYGPLFSFGTQEISDKTTLDRVSTSRKALTMSLGAIFGVDINKVDIGIFSGIDFATGSDANKWIYQGVVHYGFILGYELIKPK